jgi:hypothetical protein
MTTMQPAEQPRSRSNAALAVMLVLGNLFFWGCVVSRYAWGTMGSPHIVSQPAKFVPAKG